MAWVIKEEKEREMKNNVVITSSLKLIATKTNIYIHGALKKSRKKKQNSQTDKYMKMPKMPPKNHFDFKKDNSQIHHLKL